MEECGDWNELRSPPGNSSMPCMATERAYAIWINRQWRIVFTPVEGALADVAIEDYTDDEWSTDPKTGLHNPHAGEMLWLEFMEPLGLSAAGRSTSLDVRSDRIVDVIAGRTRIDAELDLRLGRYLVFRKGFFLRLQGQLRTA
jgi:addiction module HigA family antidote